MKIISVGTVDEVLQHTLAAPLVPIEWPDKESLEAISNASAKETVGDVVTH